MAIAGSECGGGVKRKSSLHNAAPMKKPKVSNGVVGPNLLENAVSRLKNGQSTCAPSSSRAGLPQISSSISDKSKESGLYFFCVFFYYFDVFMKLWIFSVALS